MTISFSFLLGQAEKTTRVDRTSVQEMKRIKESRNSRAALGICEVDSDTESDDSVFGSDLDE